MIEDKEHEVFVVDAEGEGNKHNPMMDEIGMDCVQIRIQHAYDDICHDKSNTNLEQNEAKRVDRARIVWGQGSGIKDNISRKDACFKGMQGRSEKGKEKRLLPSKSFYFVCCDE